MSGDSKRVQKTQAMFGRLLLLLSKEDYQKVRARLVHKISSMMSYGPVAIGFIGPEGSFDNSPETIDSRFKCSGGLWFNWRWLELCFSLHGSLVMKLPEQSFPYVGAAARRWSAWKENWVFGAAAIHHILPHAKDDLGRLIGSFL